MKHELIRPTSQHEATASGAAAHGASSTRPRVRISIGDDARSGVWWPRTADYTAEIYDLAFACGLVIGENIERIAFAWNTESSQRLPLLRSDSIILGEPEHGQPREEMRLHPAGGRTLRLIVVPPPPAAAELFAPRHAEPRTSALRP